MNQSQRHIEADVFAPTASSARAILLLVGAFLLVGMVHEFGHFLAAKLLKVPIQRIVLDFRLPFPRFRIDFLRSELEGAPHRARRFIAASGVIFNGLTAFVTLSILWVVSVIMGRNYELGSGLTVVSTGDRFFSRGDVIVAIGGCRIASPHDVSACLAAGDTFLHSFGPTSIKTVHGEQDKRSFFADYGVNEKGNSQILQTWTLNAPRRGTEQKAGILGQKLGQKESLFQQTGGLVSKKEADGDHIGILDRIEQTLRDEGADTSFGESGVYKSADDEIIQSVFPTPLVLGGLCAHPESDDLSSDGNASHHKFAEILDYELDIFNASPQYLYNYVPRELRPLGEPYAFDSPITLCMAHESCRGFNPGSRCVFPSTVSRVVASPSPTHPQGEKEEFVGAYLPVAYVPHGSRDSLKLAILLVDTHMLSEQAYEGLLPSSLSFYVARSPKFNTFWVQFARLLISFSSLLAMAASLAISGVILNSLPVSGQSDAYQYFDILLQGVERSMRQTSGNASQEGQIRKGRIPAVASPGGIAAAEADAELEIFHFAPVIAFTLRFIAIALVLANVGALLVRELLQR